MIKMYFKGKENIPHKALARRGERRPTPCVLDAWFHTTVYRVVWHQQTDSASPDQVAGGKKGEDLLFLKTFELAKITLSSLGR